MTENEAIEILKSNFPKTCKTVDGKRKGGFDDIECEFGQALLLSISALEEIQQYRAIGTVEECREARERQMAKKINNTKYLRDFNGDLYDVKGGCPNCKSNLLLSINRKHCNNCGQKLDWSE